jgi:hypothetical protein
LCPPSPRLRPRELRYERLKEKPTTKLAGEIGDLVSGEGIAPLLSVRLWPAVHDELRACLIFGTLLRLIIVVLSVLYCKILYLFSVMDVAVLILETNPR